MKVRDIHSSRVQTIPPTTSVRQALRLMVEHEIRHLPVLEDGRLLGVVSDRELLEAAGELENGRAAVEVRGLFRRDLPALSPDDTLVTAAMEMMSEKVGCLPVVDSAGALVGVLSETDLIRSYVSEGAASDPSGAAEPRVAELMSADPMTLEPGDTLAVAMEAARHRGFRHFPVLDADGDLIGVVSDRDLYRELGAGSPLDLPVDGAMTRGALTIEPQESLLLAAQRLLEQRISCLPVVEGERLVGMLTTTDLVDHCLITLGQA